MHIDINIGNIFYLVFFRLACYHKQHVLSLRRVIILKKKLISHVIMLKLLNNTILGFIHIPVFKFPNSHLGIHNLTTDISKLLLLLFYMFTNCSC